MAKPKIFYVIDIKDRNLQTIIDGIRILANPDEKHFAHITVRGPYEQKIREESLTNINDIIRNKNVGVDGVANFFEYGQNTIYLKCNSPILKDIWFKKDYKESFNPHLTIYDGRSKNFAQKLYDILNRYSFSFDIKVDEIKPIRSHKRQFNETFAYEYNFDLLSYYLKKQLTFDNIQLLDEETRLSYISDLCKYFDSWKSKAIYPSPINSIFESLDLNTENGLFYFSDFDKWKSRFPFRILRALLEIKPYAIYSLLKSGPVEELNSELENHPKPFNQPIILFFDNPSKIQEEEIHKQVFSFGQSPVIFIDKLNKIEVFNGLQFDNKSKNYKLLKIGGNEVLPNFNYRKLFSGNSWLQTKGFNDIKKIDEYLLENLSQARNVLIDKFDINPSIVNSLIGRLLFIKYLVDRGVEFRKEDSKDDDYFPGKDKYARNQKFLVLIGNPINLYHFFDYLQRKLNGDLFPVTEEERSIINKSHLEVLYYLFQGAKSYYNSNHDYHIQGSLFDVYDFKVIPIELISNIYEQFIGDGKRLQNKSFYTPSFLVDYILTESVTKKLSENGDISCKVLDPSCGSGIFLIEAVRKIIEKYIASRGDNSIDNNKLWSLVHENIFGIDIDPNAIEVAIFSLYVTVLDYVEPKIIAKDFTFRKLKDINFFPEADFFDTSHSFNAILNNIHFDFILGNPPWGQTNNSLYIKYCREREKNESQKNDIKVKIDISDRQIAQAFILRVSDFSKANTQCALVVTSKVLYNYNAKSWRKYFLTNFFVDEVFELSAVNTKIFNGAKWPAAILFYSYNHDKLDVSENVIRHITLKPNKFFNLFKTIIIEKVDYKTIKQKYFIESLGGDDWLWKVLLYGNTLDYFFIKRLKDEFKSVEEIIEENDLEHGVGLKRKDADRAKDARSLLNHPFLDTDKKEFRRFSIKPSTNWKELTAAAIPNKVDVNNFPILFKGPIALIKEGLDTGYKGVSAFSPSPIIFTHSVRAIKGTEDQINILKSLVSLFNSNLFAYYIFLTGSSTGIDFIRANQIEQLSFPVVIDDKLAVLNDEIEASIKSNESLIFINQSIDNLSELDEAIIEIYNINDVEKDLLDYTKNISIPLTKASELNKICRSINPDEGIINTYAQLFKSYFDKRLKIVNRCLTPKVIMDNDFIAIIFSTGTENLDFVIQNSNDVMDDLKTLYNISFSQISKQLYIQRDVKGFEAESFYIIKPNEYKNWHRAIARLDLAEFIDAILKSGAKQYMN
ncbi:N-6 DNA methylase [Mucilaginibacter endophyticus]|uniref:N-6 DNA methylase n=1 Tax=Mucilaginibacter endophyticus TaxID=2675003 RepID=UPI000E0DA110|nr:N-6 DNA methylase [Mucilaginibacter endophyticus]